MYAYLPFVLILLGTPMHDILAQDWANLERYRQANEALDDDPNQSVVFMGNSITEAWVDMLPEFFRETGYIGRGISGQTTPQMLVRFRQDVINLRPRAVVILAGTNDIAGNTGPATLEEIRDNIVSMAQLAQSNGIKVLICSVLPAYYYSWRPGLEPAKKIVELNKMLQDYAAQNSVTYVDYFTPMADQRNGLKEMYTYDGVHPNKAGYQAMAPIIKSALEAVLSKNN